MNKKRSYVTKKKEDDAISTNRSIKKYSYIILLITLENEPEKIFFY